jgi:hypothetical protein
MNPEKWYCLIEGSEQGPYTSDQLVGLVKSGSLKSHDLVKQDVTGSWQPLRSFPKLTSQIASVRESFAGFERFYRIWFIAQFVGPPVIALIVTGLYAALIHPWNQRSDRSSTMILSGMWMMTAIAFLLAMVFAPLASAPTAWFQGSPKGQYWHMKFGQGAPLPVLRGLYGMLAVIGLFLICVVFWGFTSGGQR